MCVLYMYVCALHVHVCMRVAYVCFVRVCVICGYMYLCIHVYSSLCVMFMEQPLFCEIIPATPFQKVFHLPQQQLCSP